MTASDQSAEGALSSAHDANTSCVQEAIVVSDIWPSFHVHVPWSLLGGTCQSTKTHAIMDPGEVENQSHGQQAVKSSDNFVVSDFHVPAAAPLGDDCRICWGSLTGLGYHPGMLCWYLSCP